MGLDSKCFDKSALFKAYALQSRTCKFARLFLAAIFYLNFGVVLSGWLAKRGP